MVMAQFHAKPEFQIDQLSRDRRSAHVEGAFGGSDAAGQNDRLKHP